MAAKKTEKEVAKAPQKKGKGGRPKGKAGPIAKNKHVLEEHTLNTIERMAERGMELQDVAFFLDIPQSTFRKLRNEFPEINERYLKGKAKGIAEVKLTAYNVAATAKCTATMRWWLEREEEKLNIVAEKKTANNSGLKITRDRLIDAIKKDPFMEITETSVDASEPFEEIDVTPVIDPMGEE